MRSRLPCPLLSRRKHHQPASQLMRRLYRSQTINAVLKCLLYEECSGILASGCRCHLVGDGWEACGEALRSSVCSGASTLQHSVQTPLGDSVRAAPGSGSASVLTGAGSWLHAKCQFSWPYSAHTPR